MVADIKECISNRLIVSLMNSMPDMTMLLTAEGQIISANNSMIDFLGIQCIEHVAGLSFGEALGCSGANDAVAECVSTRSTVTRDIHIRTRDSADLDVSIRTSVLPFEGQDFVVAAMKDISAEKLSYAIERMFFHDILNMAGGVRGLSGLLVDASNDPETAAEYSQDIYNLSDQLIDDIQAHRQLLAIENDRLNANISECDLAELMEAVVSQYRRHEQAYRKTLTLMETPANLKIMTDESILKRVLGNMIKGALKSTPPAGEVKLWAMERHDSVEFIVHSDGTEGDDIRIYMIRLFTENACGGKVDFTSTEIDGTTFKVTLPKHYTGKTSA